MQVTQALGSPPFAARAGNLRRAAVVHVVDALVVDIWSCRMLSYRYLLCMHAQRCIQCTCQLAERAMLHALLASLAIHASTPGSGQPIQGDSSRALCVCMALLTRPIQVVVQHKAHGGGLGIVSVLHNMTVPATQLSIAALLLHAAIPVNWQLQLAGHVKHARAKPSLLLACLITQWLATVAIGMCLHAFSTH